MVLNRQSIDLVWPVSLYDTRIRICVLYIDPDETSHVTRFGMIYGFTVIIEEIYKISHYNHELD